MAVVVFVSVDVSNVLVVSVFGNIVAAVLAVLVEALLSFPGSAHHRPRPPSSPGLGGRCWT